MYFYYSEIVVICLELRHKLQECIQYSFHSRRRGQDYKFLQTQEN